MIESIRSGSWRISFAFGEEPFLHFEPAQPESSRAEIAWARSADFQAPASAAGLAVAREAGGAGYLSLLFDGLLYNRKELGEQLGSTRFVGEKPLEVLGEAYRRWGKEFLGRIKGVLALVVWDREAELLLCATDRLGSHPLFYTRAGSKQLISPSIDALVEVTAVSRAINRAVIAESLYEPGSKLDETCYESIRCLPPGHALEFSPSGRRVVAYRAVPPATPDSELSRAEAVERFAELFESAVARCLEGGRAGVLLSGGLDSVAVASAAADVARRQNGSDPVALSIIVSHPDCAEENDIQQEVAEALRLPHILLPPEVDGRSMLSSALELSRAWPVPLMNFWQPTLAHLIALGRSRGCRVILTGAGGDEWLGLSHHVAADFIRGGKWRVLARIGRSLADSYGLPRGQALRIIGWKYGLRPLIREALVTFLVHHAPERVARMRSERAPKGIPQWISREPQLRRRLTERREEKILRPTGETVHRADRLGMLNRPLAFLLRREFFEAGRRAGTRILEPFWDGDLNDFLQTMPAEYLVWKGRSKEPLRELLDQRFPRLGFGRQKKFDYEPYIWSTIEREGRQVWKKLGDSPALADLRIIDHDILQTRVTEMFSTRNWSDCYWFLNVLNVEAWLRRRS